MFSIDFGDKLIGLDKLKRVQLLGIQGSSIAFLAQNLYRKVNAPLLFIAPDQESALYLFNDLQHTINEKVTHYFPASLKNPYEEEKTTNANVQERAEVLNFLNHTSSPFVLVTYPEALFEKVISRQVLTQNTFEVRVKEKLSMEFLEEYLMSYKFEREDFVIEPGQYAIRGGIIDVFSFSSDYPFRIELLGEEIESIRSFDTLTQLSVSNYDRISIIPNVSSQYIAEKKQDFISYLPDETVLLIEHAERVVEKINQQYQQSWNKYNSLSQTAQQEPAQLYCSGDEIKEALLKLHWIEYGGHHLFNDYTLTFNQSPQPVFNKKFDLLLRDLIENKKKGFRNILFTDSQKQAERLEQIFHDISIENKVPQQLIEPVFLSIHEGFIDHELKIACYTDHQIFERYHKYRLKSQSYKKAEALSVKELMGLSPGDYVTHIDHGVGRFAGLEKIDVNGKTQEAVKLVYKDNDVLYVSIHSLHRISKYAGKEGKAPRIDKIGSSVWQTLKQKTKRKVKEIAFDLISLYARRKAQKGHAFSKDNYMQHELEASFIYEDTPDQIKTTNDVKKDMEKIYPMDRLVCGDVGFGKTEIAIRAAFKAVCDGKQVAVMVPTTILAFQHFKTFKERLRDFPCNIDFINRFKPAKEQKEALEKLEKGKIDILIGTHKLVSKEVIFKDLGLLIIDEEQKFGVGVKDKLKTIKLNVDTLTLTATPIPRTLQFSLMGARDLSVIATPPPNRYPVQTELHAFQEELIRDAISYEIKRGGQIFFIHNKVQSIQEIAGTIQRLVPSARVAVGHGQMEGDKLEKVMLNFIEGAFDVLVATTIVESGLDISNANTIIINDAQNFGLSDLHQMRGRVGRSNKKAFCYLLCPSLLTLTNDARKRLKAITEFTDLGSGFQIAMRDLDIRGAGDLLGGEQSGFINDMGFETYMKILSEAIDELKEEEWYKEQMHSEDQDNDSGKAAFSRSFVKETIIDTDFELLIPDFYIGNITERLTLYRELDNISKELDLIKFENNLRDRFGPMPVQVQNLMAAMRMRWLAMEIGFEKLILKNGKMIAYFLSKQDSEYFNTPVFKAVLAYAQKLPHQCKLKEANNKLTFTVEGVKQVKDVSGIFNYIRSMASDYVKKEAQ